MSELQFAEGAVEWFVQTFGNAIQKADEKAGRAILDFWENPSPASKAALVSAGTAAIKANAASFTAPPPAAVSADPEPPRHPASESIYQEGVK